MFSWVLGVKESISVNNMSNLHLTYYSEQEAIRVYFALREL